MWEQQSFHGPSLICKSLSRWPATPSKPVSVVHRFSLLYNWQVKYSIQHCYEKNVPTGVIRTYLIRFSSSRHCWKHLLLRDTLVWNILNETTEWQMFIVHQRWHCALGQEPLSQHIGQLWTPAISPFLFIFKTKTFSFSLKQALSNNVFGVKIGRTAMLRRLFKVINFRRSKFVCTLSPCPVFGHVRGRPGNALDNAGLPPLHAPRQLYCIVLYCICLK